MTDLESGHAVRDVSDVVVPVTARSPLLPGTSLSGHRNAGHFFFAGAQIGEISDLSSTGQLRPCGDGGWEEVIPGEGLRRLAEVWIDGVRHYRLLDHWRFTAG